MVEGVDFMNDLLFFAEFNDFHDAVVQEMQCSEITNFTEYVAYVVVHQMPFSIFLNHFDVFYKYINEQTLITCRSLCQQKVVCIHGIPYERDYILLHYILLYSGHIPWISTFENHQWVMDYFKVYVFFFHPCHKNLFF